jgi:hypothetical protein
LVLPCFQGIRLTEVIRDQEIDLLPYISWDGERSQIDILKEQLIEGKRALNSASLQAALPLSEELELLSRGISYRAAGELKCDLMLNLIDVYRSKLGLEDKARALQRSVRRGEFTFVEEGIHLYSLQ